MSVDPSGVSVVVAHYGDPAPTRSVVSDLMKQQTDRPLEIVVVDDASPRALGGLPGAARIVRRESNGGYGSAVNTGASVSSMPLLLILNSDLALAPDFIERFVVAASPHLPCVAGPATQEAGSYLVTGRRFPRLWRHVVEGLQPLHRWSERDWYQRLIGRDLRCGTNDIVVDVDWVQGSALLLPRASFAAVSGFDERFFMYSEEVDLQRRLHDLGVPSVFIGTVAVEHAGGTSTDSGNRTAWLVRSQLTYAEKWSSARALRVALIGVACVNLAFNLGRRVAGAGSSPRHRWRTETRLARLPVWPAARVADDDPRPSIGLGPR